MNSICTAPVSMKANLMRKFPRWPRYVDCASRSLPSGGQSTTCASSNANLSVHALAAARASRTTMPTCTTDPNSILLIGLLGVPFPVPSKNASSSQTARKHDVLKERLPVHGLCFDDS